MKEANIENLEFIEKYNQIKKSGKNYMTLFIDNIRLYNRKINFTIESDKLWVEKLLLKNDLLKLCTQLPDMKFIIFTGFEDTPIDEYIFNKIPDNVLNIFAANAISFNKKVIPIPYGLKRKMNTGDNNLEILSSFINNDKTLPNNLLYINHLISNNVSVRGNINNMFSDKHWATVNAKRLNYNLYLQKLKQHKFMISPIGNAIDCDCHRNWELFYLKRVPVVKNCNYLKHLFEGYPVLFVENFSDVTESLLIKNNHLYEEALKIDSKKLDLEILFNLYIKKSITKI